jgi:hypothetical protein
MTVPSVMATYTMMVQKVWAMVKTLIICFVPGKVAMLVDISEQDQVIREVAS